MKLKLSVWSIVMGASLLMMSCVTAFDNYKVPDSSITGRVIDATTGENLITSQGEFEIRYWETSWTQSVPGTQSIPIKQDGTFQDVRLFDGTYDMQAYDGPFWPMPVESDLVLKRSLVKDFKVTPYMHLDDIEGRIVDDSLYMSFKLSAPIEDFQVKEMNPYISWTPFCGGSANIGELVGAAYRLTITRPWAQMKTDFQAESGASEWRPAPGPKPVPEGAEPGSYGMWEPNIIDRNPDDIEDNDMNYWYYDVATDRFEVGPIALIVNTGYTYRARVGASNDQPETGDKTNYSKIITFKYNENGTWTTPAVVE